MPNRGIQQQESTISRGIESLDTHLSSEFFGVEIISKYMSDDWRVSAFGDYY